MRRTLIAAAVLSTGFTSFAFADDCDSSSLNIFDRVYCQNKVFVTEDARLNEAYSNLRTHLSDTQRSTLLDAQRNWIEYRNDRCVGQSEEWGEVVYANCAVRTTRDRAEFLEARINECKSVGCATSKLSEY